MRFFSSRTTTEKGAARRRSGAVRAFRLLAFGLAWQTSLPLAAAEQVDFTHLELEAGSFWNGSDLSGGFRTNGAFFNNEYNAEWDTWSGWAYSNVRDNETRGYQNQYASIVGEGVAGREIYGIANVNFFDPVFPAVELPAHTAPGSIAVTNTAYAYYSMLEGDDFAKQFSVEDDDWFLLTIAGRDADGGTTGEIDFYLADYRFENPEDAYIIDEWTVVDLSSLGAATRRLEFTLSSSDTGDLGMNTPAYFAAGRLTVVAEDPFAAWMAMLPEDGQPPEGERGLLDEPAGDGVSNLLKYAFGASPMTPYAGGKPRLAVVESGETPEAGAGLLAMEFVRSKDAAVRFVLEGSGDLTGWQELPFTVEQVEDIDAARERVRLRSDIASGDYGAYFLRLNVALED